MKILKTVCTQFYTSSDIFYVCGPTLLPTLLTSSSKSLHTTWYNNAPTPHPKSSVYIIRKISFFIPLIHFSAQKPEYCQNGKNLFWQFYLTHYMVYDTALLLFSKTAKIKWAILADGGGGVAIPRSV